MELWESYHFCPRCGVQHSQNLTIPFNCGACGFTRYFNPVCAVAAVVANPAGHLLFIRRAREPSRGKLGMPGGFVDRGESAEEALRREVIEEVGLRLDRLEYLGSWPNRYPTAVGEVNVCDFFFTAEVPHSSTTVAAEEVSEIVWLHPRELRPYELAFDSMREALRRFNEQR